MSWLSDLLKDYPALSVAKQRLQLAQDRIDALEREKLELGTEVDELRTQNAELERQLGELESAEAQQDGSDLDEDAKRMLRLLFESDEVSLEQISAQLGLELPMVEYHRDVLGEREFIQVGTMTVASTFIGDEGFVGWRITPAGRKFVIEVIGRE